MTIYINKLNVIVGNWRIETECLMRFSTEFFVCPQWKHVDVALGGIVVLFVALEKEWEYNLTPGERLISFRKPKKTKPPKINSNSLRCVSDIRHKRKHFVCVSSFDTRNPKLREKSRAESVSLVWFQIKVFEPFGLVLFCFVVILFVCFFLVFVSTNFF